MGCKLLWLRLGGNAQDLGILLGWPAGWEEYRGLLTEGFVEEFRSLAVVLHAPGLAAAGWHFESTFGYLNKMLSRCKDPCARHDTRRSFVEDARANLDFTEFLRGELDQAADSLPGGAPLRVVGGRLEDVFAAAMSKLLASTVMTDGGAVLPPNQTQND